MNQGFYLTLMMGGFNASPVPQPVVEALTDVQVTSTVGSQGGFQLKFAMGRNSYLRTRYLPPDPSPGHGAHRYAFQILAVDRRADFSDAPGRGDLVDALRRRVLAAGCLIGTYERP